MRVEVWYAALAYLALLVVVVVGCAILSLRDHLRPLDRVRAWRRERWTRTSL